MERDLGVALRRLDQGSGEIAAHAEGRDLDPVRIQEGGPEHMVALLLGGGEDCRGTGPLRVLHLLPSEAAAARGQGDRILGKVGEVVGVAAAFDDHHRCRDVAGSGVDQRAVVTLHGPGRVVTLDLEGRGAGIREEREAEFLALDVPACLLQALGNVVGARVVAGRSSGAGAVVRFGDVEERGEVGRHLVGAEGGAQSFGGARHARHDTRRRFGGRDGRRRCAGGGHEEPNERAGSGTDS